LEIFWHTHDPTTLNQQGNDFGTQYRSAIFFHNEKQRKEAEKIKLDLEKEGVYRDKIVTEITAFTNFYVAEDYHKNYYEKNKDKSYCNFVITPKISKLIKEYYQDLKEEYAE
jgi:peptide-methionine (S)-S-oxide reductase